MRKKLLIIIIPLILFGVLLAVNRSERSLPVVYRQGDKVMVKERGKEPVFLSELEFIGSQGEAYVYTPENGVVFKECYGDFGETGSLRYLSLSSEGAKPASIEENGVGHIEITGELTVYRGNGLKIFDGEKTIAVDTEVPDFRITPDKKKMFYWKGDGKVYRANISAEPEPELLFDTKEKTTDFRAYPVYCSPDLKHMVFVCNGNLYSYKKGVCKKIADEVKVPAVVGDVIYYGKGKRIYCYMNGKERLIDEIFTMNNHSECRDLEDNSCFKKSRFAVYNKLNKGGKIAKSYYLTGTLEKHTFEKGGHIICQGDNTYTMDNGDLIRYSITQKGFKDEKKLHSNADEIYYLDDNRFVAEFSKGVYLVTGGKSGKVSNITGNRDYAMVKNDLCFISEDNILYCNNKKIAEKVKTFQLREDGSIVWLTKNNKLYVKYKNSKPELVEDNVKKFYRVR